MKTFKKLSAVILAVLIAFMLSACGTKELPEGFDEKEIVRSAEKVIELLSEKDYEAVTEQFSDVMEGLTAEKISEAMEKKLGRIGEYKESTLKGITGGNSEETGDFVTAVMISEYETGSLVYTISFDRDGRICGLSMA